jgi:hypothetical protein
LRRKRRRALLKPSKSRTNVILTLSSSVKQDRWGLKKPAICYRKRVGT